MGDDWGKIGLLFILTSGHTGQAQKRFVLFLAKLVFEYEPQQKEREKEKEREREKEREKAKLFPSKDKLFIRLKVRSKLVSGFNQKMKKRISTFCLNSNSKFSYTAFLVKLKTDLTLGRDRGECTLTVLVQIPVKSIKVIGA